MTVINNKCMKNIHNIHNIIEVSELMEVLEQGVSKPIRCRLEDGRLAILKHSNNIFGVQSVVNEFVASCIAEELEIKIPKFGVCHVIQKLIAETSPDVMFEFEDFEAGLYFFSEDINNVIPLSRGQLMVQQIKPFSLERLILFDLLIFNNERHEGNILISLDETESEIVAIDHGTIFTDSVRYDNESLLKMLNNSDLHIEEILEKNRITYEILDFKFSVKNEELIKEIDHIKTVITADYLDQVKSLVPNEWKDLMEGKVDLLFDNIKKRLVAIDDIKDELLKIIGGRS